MDPFEDIPSDMDVDLARAAELVDVPAFPPNLLAPHFPIRSNHRCFTLEELELVVVGQVPPDSVRAAATEMVYEERLKYFRDRLVMTAQQTHFQPLTASSLDLDEYMYGVSAHSFLYLVTLALTVFYF